METENDRLKGALAIVDSVIDRLEKSQFMIEEQQERDDEALKEKAHREDEGLDDDLEEKHSDHQQGMIDSGMCEGDFL
jgi:hypothetical protein